MPDIILVQQMTIASDRMLEARDLAEYATITKADLDVIATKAKEALQALAMIAERVTNLAT